MDIPDIPYKILFREAYMEKHFPDFVRFLKTKYPMISTYKEMVYLFIHGMDEPPTCPTCGKYKKYRNSPAGYGIYCDRSCVNNELKTLKTKQTKLDRYGDESFNNSEKARSTNLEKYGTECTINNPDIKKKAQKTNMERYGVDNPFKSKEIQQRIAEQNKSRSIAEKNIIREKVKRTCLKRYGVENPMSSPEIQDKFKSTMIKKYGVEYAMLSDELNKKCSDSITQAHRLGKYNITHRKNNTFSTSSIEEQFASYLDDNRVDYIRQYRGLKYPFDCDFYIPRYDLYIEIQGTWLHGKHPFDPDNDEDRAVVEYWDSKQSRYYKSAIYTWTDLDPRKRKTAKDAKLNYLEIFSIDIDVVVTKYNDFINGLGS